MPAYQVDITTYDSFRAACLDQAAKGLGFDLDGAFGYQCWDLGQLLYSQLGRNFVTKNSFTGAGGTDTYVQTTWEYEAARNQNGSSPFTLVYRWTDIKRGDLIIWRAGGCNGNIGITGHNAYADQDVTGSGNITCLGQNQTGQEVPAGGYPPTLNNYFNSDGFLGAFRYTKWDSSTPPGPDPGPGPSGSVLHPQYTNIPVLVKGLRLNRKVI